MKFNIMGIIFMMIAIALGTMLGSMIAGMVGGIVGTTGGLIGVFIVGLGVYAVYSLLNGQPLKLMTGLMFAGLVWISGLITGMVSGATGLGGGIIGLAIQAILLGFLAGYFLKGETPLGATQKKSTGKRRRR